MPRVRAIGSGTNGDSGKSQPPAAAAAAATAATSNGVAATEAAASAAASPSMPSEAEVPQPRLLWHAVDGRDVDSDPEVLDVEVEDVDDLAAEEELGQAHFYRDGGLNGASQLEAGRRLALPKGEQAQWEGRLAWPKGEGTRLALPKGEEANCNRVGLVFGGLPKGEGRLALPKGEEVGLLPPDEGATSPAAGAEGLEPRAPAGGGRSTPKAKDRGYPGRAEPALAARWAPPAEPSRPAVAHKRLAAPVEVRDDVAWAAGVDGGEEPVTGESVGLWLDESDFVITHDGGHQVGLGSAVDVGTHGFPRDWPRVYQSSMVLKNLLKKSGPCPAKRVCRTGSPESQFQSLVQDVQLTPLQSFENASAVAAKTGMPVVRGWAVYDLLNASPGEGYMAERYWWNSTGQGEWLDFTPRPDSMPALLLVEAAEVSPREACVLTDQHMALSDGLACLRFRGATATVRTEFGRYGPESLSLTGADIKGGCGLRRAMMAAAMGGALTGQLSNDKNLFPIVLLLSVLIRCLQSDPVLDDGLEMFVAADGIDVLMELLQSKSAEIAAAAAAGLALICRRSCSAKQRTKAQGGANLLARVFARADVDTPSCRIGDAARAFWRTQPVAVDAVLGEREAVGPWDMGSQEYWEGLRACCESLQQSHAQGSPLERRAWSWARTLAFARVALGSRGVAVRRGTPERPFVIWVLGAEEAVEVQLAKDGFFSDANFFDRAPTEIVMFGDGLQEFSSGGEPREGKPPVIHATGTEFLVWKLRLGEDPPDLAVVFMPEAPEPQAEGSQPGQAAAAPLPDVVLTAVAHIPVVVSTRYGLGESGAMALRCKLRGQIVLPQVRSPFSSAAARPQSLLDDNGWVFAVCGPGSLAKAMQMEVPPLQAPKDAQQGPGKAPALFWGILDIKYDTSRPVLERVKVLETGDGRTSKFSGDGADILRRYKERYQLEQDPDMQMYQVISADKKLTHDLFEQTGYSHIVPRQVCLSRIYHDGLAGEIVNALGLGACDNVILKLCNRSRAAGVVVTPVDELDDILRDLLHPPEDLDAWLKARVGTMMTGSPVDFGFQPGDLEEHMRHWWSNESPVFVAETCCRSVPTVLNGRSFDGTLRVGFALRRKQSGRKPWEQHGATSAPEDLDIDWLGGYWKLPKGDSGSGSLREAVVSAARISGTAPVKLAHLFEVYAALGDSVQQLFSSAEPSSEEIRKRYQSHPGLASYLTARIGTAAMSRHPVRTREMLADADKTASKLAEGQEKATVQSFLYRAHGVFEAKQKTDPAKSDPQSWLHDSLRLHPTNSMTLHLLGVAALQDRRLQDGVELLSKSLLLDPDFKASYVNIGIAYLRLGQYERAIEVSEAGLARHPDAPQPHYHIGVACCQLALAMMPGGNGSTEVPLGDRSRYEELRQRSLAGFSRARTSDEGRKRSRQKQEGPDSPWLEIDDKMFVAMEKDVGFGPLELPANIGWFWHSYRL